MSAPGFQMEEEWVELQKRDTSGCAVSILITHYIITHNATY